MEEVQEERVVAPNLTSEQEQQRQAQALAELQTRAGQIETALQQQTLAAAQARAVAAKGHKPAACAGSRDPAELEQWSLQIC